MGKGRVREGTGWKGRKRDGRRDGPYRKFLDPPLSALQRARIASVGGAVKLERT